MLCYWGEEVRLMLLLLLLLLWERYGRLLHWHWSDEVVLLDEKERHRLLPEG